jgi:hypothetical protein
MIFDLLQLLFSDVAARFFIKENRVAIGDKYVRWRDFQFARTATEECIKACVDALFCGIEILDECAVHNQTSLYDF